MTTVVEYDCCDASDEYDSGTFCPNTCRKLGQKERAEVENTIGGMHEGLRLKQQLIEEGNAIWQEKQQQMEQLQQNLMILQGKLIRLREAKETLERTVKEKHKMASNKVPSVLGEKDLPPETVFEELDINKDGMLSLSEIHAHVKPKQDEKHVILESDISIS
nr:PREDICTED: glucosidase 2 subunit beta-like [Latimeria chalumnae]|eukprot:XP_014346198.1 PREDICTED: glucosidase 2 subunit beta-like [Latimeria chalumnae]